MLRNSRQHLRSTWRFATKSNNKQPSTSRKLPPPTTFRRWLASEARPHMTMPSSSSSSSAPRHGRRAAGYITAGTTVGVITCYRSDSLIANDPYNIFGAVVAVLAHNAVNPTPHFSWPLLLGSLAVGEFLGNGFRHVHQQYSGIIVTEEERHQLLEDVTEIFASENENHHQPTENDKDLLDVFENGVSAILLQSKTRWMHLCNHSHHHHHHDGHHPVHHHAHHDEDYNHHHHGHGHHVPDHMSTEELKTAILNMQHKNNNKTGEEEEDDELTKEALLQVLSVADIHNDGVITFMEFSRALLLLEFAKRDVGSARSELYFRAIDLHNNGSINQEELLHFAKRLHALGGIPHKDRTTPHWSGLYERPSTPEEICAKWMDRFDVNHDGLISREDFDKMAKEIDFGPSFVFTKYFDRTPE